MVGEGGNTPAAVSAFASYSNTEQSVPKHSVVFSYAGGRHRRARVLTSARSFASAGRWQGQGQLPMAVA